METTLKKGKRMKISGAEELGDKRNHKSKSGKKDFSIFGYSVWQILQYFIIYSFLGLVIETLFGLLTKGVIESRKSVLYGPFCCIYGLGAICLVCIPENAKKNNYTLFAAGFIIGSILEYIVSLIGECIFHVKWWDYSDFAFNINGRICLLFSVFWGILTIFLNTFINPKVDEFIEKIPIKRLHVATVLLIIFILLNIIITSFALKVFSTRLIYNYNLEVQGMEEYYEQYLDIYKNNEQFKKIVDKFFSDKKMLKTFPNLKFTLKNGNILLVQDILVDIKPYYIKVFLK